MAGQVTDIVDDLFEARKRCDILALKLETEARRTQDVLQELVKVEAQRDKLLTACEAVRANLFYDSSRPGQYMAWKLVGAALAAAKGE